MTLNEWSAIVGAILPPLIAVINQPRWQPWQRALATVAICATVGSVAAALQGRLSAGTSVLQSIGIVMVATLAAYHAWWKPSGITGAIEKTTDTRRRR